MINLRKYKMAMALGGALMALAACEPSGVHVSGGVYYDSMLWNDYYYGHRPGYRPPHNGRPPDARPPQQPPRPSHPIEPPRPKPPAARPPRPRPPVARPRPARPPIHRPAPSRRR